MSILTLPRGTKVPDHIVIIPDGNRRWARARGLPDAEGHKAGAKALKELLSASRQLGVHTATFWGLSTENWKERSEAEVKWLMKIISRGIDSHITDAKRDGVRVIHLGRKDRLPIAVLEKLAKAEAETAKNKKHIFNIALDYGGQDEIIRAIQKIVESGIGKDKINTTLLDSNMDTAGQPYPYPDMIIRTSGEQRTSGALLWQSHYAETYWEQCHFPDFSPEKLRESILDYSRRRRRFGGDDEAEHLKFKPEMVAKFELAWWRLGNIPEGERFRDYALKHMREQYGMSKKLAREASGYMIDAFFHGQASKWTKAKSSLKKFYVLVRDEVKLAFEPSLVASLEVKLLKNLNSVDAEATAREFYAEVYRISLLQAAKLAHLRVLANIERNLALAGMGEAHWDRAEDYLQKFYKELKDRVA